MRVGARSALLHVVCSCCMLPGSETKHDPLCTPVSPLAALCALKVAVDGSHGVLPGWGGSQLHLRLLMEFQPPAPC